MDNSMYKIMMENLPFAYTMHKIIVDEWNNPVDYKFIEVNDAFETFTGIKKDFIVGKRITEIKPEMKSNNVDWMEKYRDIAMNGGQYEFEEYSEDLGKWFKVKVFGPCVGYFATFFIDITQELKERNLYKSTLLSLEEGIVAIDKEGNITMTNEAANKFIGNNKGNIIKSRLCDLLENIKMDNIVQVCDNIFSVINGGNSIKEAETTKKNDIGNDISLLYNVYPVRNNYEHIEGAVVSFWDITERIEKQKKIDYMTYHDSLTGIYNRTFFTNEIKRVDIKENMPISIIMGDVNGLKLTNDAFGHLLGDKLLVEASNVLKKSCRDSDLIIRWGGDEFIILLPKTSEVQARKISERIKLDCKKKKVDSINLSISVGYATKSDIEDNIIKTITTSEEMMYRIKMVESKSQKSKTLKVIAKTLKEKSIQDAEHSKNVSKICKLIGKELGMSAKELTELEILGDIHDIGKVTINKEVLNKRETLNDKEWEEVKKHSDVGYHIALSSPELSFLAYPILYHHERYDGEGYPKGIRGKEIPLYSRILFIADAFDSMAGFRVYKKRMNKQEIINEFLSCSERQFDPKLVEVFVNNVINDSWIKENYWDRL